MQPLISAKQKPLRKQLYSATRCAVLFLSLLGMSPHSTIAAEDELLVSGMVLDRTISGFGRDFSYYFSAYWRDLPATSGMTLVIHERVYPQAGTLLWLELNQRRIYQTYLGRRQQDMREFAEQAVMATIEEIARLQSANMLGEDSTELENYLD
ncbi:MAG: curli production assembly/transport protein CsgE [Rheinheimera sp.]|nr:curli production assembly/transport protein CsgE [Rheinheimera sp.]